MAHQGKPGGNKGSDAVEGWGVVRAVRMEAAESGGFRTDFYSPQVPEPENDCIHQDCEGVVVVEVQMLREIPLDPHQPHDSEVIRDVNDGDAEAIPELAWFSEVQQLPTQRRHGGLTHPHQTLDHVLIEQGEVTQNKCVGQVPGEIAEESDQMETGQRPVLLGCSEHLSCRPLPTEPTRGLIVFYS